MGDSRRRKQNPSKRVIQRVADEKGVSACELSPLFDAIDPDALDNLFDYDVSTRDGTGQVRFEYEGHTVIVDSSGRVGVSETTE